MLKFERHRTWNNGDVSGQLAYGCLFRLDHALEKKDLSEGLVDRLEFCVAIHLNLLTLSLG